MDASLSAEGCIHFVFSGILKKASIRRPAQSLMAWMRIVPAEHNLGGESTILISKCTCAAGFFCNMGDGLNADPVFPPLRGAENAVLFVDLAVKRIFNLDQKNPISIYIGGYFDLPPARYGAKTRFQRIFQQVGK